MQERVHQEQCVIQQTSNALNQCCGSQSTFAGSQEAVECHKLLLIACTHMYTSCNVILTDYYVKLLWLLFAGKKREALMTEMHKLKQGIETPQHGPKGSLTVSDIRLPLKQDFMQKIGGPHGSCDEVH